MTNTFNKNSFYHTSLGSTSITSPFERPLLLLSGSTTLIVISGKIFASMFMWILRRSSSAAIPTAHLRLFEELILGVAALR